MNHLNEQDIHWDIFSGLMADLSKDVRILETHLYKNQQFVKLDRVISMVFNVYHRRIFDVIAEWDQTNRDVTTNTIDRYLEKQRTVNVLTAVPFLVGHKGSQESTLWDVKNSEYTELILGSSQLLGEKIRAYEANTKS